MMTQIKDRIINWSFSDLVEVELTNSKESFNIVAETLRRIGIANKEKKELYQTCHLFHKNGKYYIVHFKELFGIFGKSVLMNSEDLLRRNYIINLLEEWGLIKLNDENKNKIKLFTNSKLHILKYKEKDEWKLIPKFSFNKTLDLVE